MLQDLEINSVASLRITYNLNIRHIQSKHSLSGSVNTREIHHTLSISFWMEKGIHSLLLVFLTNKHSDFTCIYLFIDKFLSFIYTQKTKKSKLSSHRFILYWPIIKIDMENEKKKFAYCIFTWARVLWQGMFNFHTSLKSAFSLLIPVYTKLQSPELLLFSHFLRFSSHPAKEH